jgi:MoxR-like ATPase
MTITASRTSVELGLPGVVRIPPGKRSCLTCPSAVSVSAQTGNFGAGIGTPACGKKMIPLAVPTADLEVQARQLTHHASGCDDYGKPWNGFAASAFTDTYQFDIAFPTPANQQTDPDDEEDGDGPRVTPKRALNCTACVNFIPAVQVRSEFGFNAPMCAAKGALILEDRLADYTRGCPDNEAAPVGADRADIKKIRLFPEFSRSFGVVDPTAASKKARTVSPTEWITEAPVSDEDAANGIRAWRRIVDPEQTGPDVFLPIYHTEYFGEDADLIPRVTGDDRPDLYVDYAGTVYKVAFTWRFLRMTPALWGMPGVGKTEVFRHMGYLMNSPYIRISFTGATEYDDVFGKMMYDPERGTYFHEGRLTQRITKPGIILLDEPNVASDVIWQSIRPLTDNARQLVIDAGVKNRAYQLHKNAFMGLAMNPAYDFRNVGTNPLGDADARRLLHLNVPMPPEPVEIAIINDHCRALDGGELDVELMTKLMRVATDIRALSDDGSVNVTWGPANNIKVARLLRYLKPRTAFAMAVLDYLDPDARKLVNESIDTVFA